MGMLDTFPKAFETYWPGLGGIDLLVGLAGAAGMYLLIQSKIRQAKKFRRDAEYGTARFGTKEDIKPFVDPKFQNNVILTGTEFLTMNTRPKIPANARNLNACVIGSSGSGKTTLLRCLNFLERPDTGVIKVNGETMWDAADPATQRESEVRKKRLHFGLVFQNFNLFPQYTALENVMLAGELLAKEQPDYKANKKAIHAQLEAQARDLLAQMGLSERAGHYPHQLSGGQQQRVAIARALALHPDILCFDEPTSALDPELTGEVLRVLRDLADRKTTMIIVTHEMHFARDVADRILFMDGGVVVEEGPARQLIDHPQEERTKQFLAHYSE